MKTSARTGRVLRVVGAVALLWAIAPQSEAQAPPIGPQDPTRSDAKRLYTSACAPCHGRNGDGREPGLRLPNNNHPRDFTTAVYKFRSTPTGSLPQDDDIYRTISRGVPGTWMPAWGDMLRPPERWALVRYVKGFSPLFGQEEPDPAIAIPEEPGSTPDLIQEGGFVYVLLKCWQCHGPSGRGDGPSADELTDDWDHKIRAYDFTRGRYKNGSAPADLYRTLVTGLNGTPMPAYEPDAVAFPGGAGTEPTPIPEFLDAAGKRALSTYLVSQPTQDQLSAMTDGDLDELVRHRMWALVYFLRSLERSRDAWYWLVRENPQRLTGRAR